MAIGFLYYKVLLFNLNRCIMGNFFKLIVWQKARELAVKIYKITANPNISKDYGFKDQIQRAAVSIPSNIAEGDELGTDKQSIRHFYIAKGSSAELITLLLIGQDIGYINSNDTNNFVSECKIIGTMLAKLIKSRSN